MINNKKLNKNKTFSSKKIKSLWIIIGSIIIISLFFSYFNKSKSTIMISERRFQNMLLNEEIKEIVLITNQNLVELKLKKENIEKYRNELGRHLQRDFHYYFKIPSFQVFNDNFKEIESKLSPDKRVGYISEERLDISNFIFNWGFFIFFIISFWFLLRRMSKGVGSGGQIFSIGKSKASLFDSKSKLKITFDDVAGLKGAKEEVMEIVEFLKDSKKFTNLGGSIPKGVLLIGAPGTGKTLLAKAVAGEANVPFFSLSGSDFMEMFIGVGSARVRDLFKKAKNKAPCIVFIDEIDAVGRSRGKSGMQGVNDERESTLNSLLVEMDGFDTSSCVIILAATNRPDVLDQALLRPGRFDRRVNIDKPDIAERKEIFMVHIKTLKISKNIDLKKLASQTPGFVGADISNICNEAALIAARKNKKFINMSDFQDAIDRVIGGLEKKNKVIFPEEKRVIAYHEAGHAVAGWFFVFANPLVKVSIVPRGIAALGYAQYLPKEQYIYQTNQMLDEICVALGGRVAEFLILGKISTGALSDLEKVTRMAYNMIIIYGMSVKLGNISFYNSDQSSSLIPSKPYSENTSMIIDSEVRKLIAICYKRTENVLSIKIQELKIIAKSLLKKETIFQSDLKKLIGKRPVNFNKSNK